MQGEMNELWTHLSASMQLGEILRPTAGQRPRSRRMIDICTFLHIIKDTTQWDSMLSPWNSRKTVFTESSFFESGVIESTYGITTILAALIERITDLARSVQFYNTHAIDPPADFQTACAHLSNATESLPTSRNSTGFSPDCDERTTIVSDIHLDAFALAIKVYYHACVRPCSPAQMDDLVHHVLRKLEAIEAHKRLTEAQHVRSATIAWPGFIASCEARQGTREPWVRWWADMQGYGIGNINTLWNIVQECWRLRDENPNVTAVWMEALRTRNKFILAV